ncbi:MAG: hypothetical protein Q3961_05325, partial [Bifidobacteriaceae bacterium]|nr:hypothetical protein [Bifidobacteriaceae bacterium]
MFCRKCGSQIPENGNYCLTCGTPVADNSIAGKVNEAFNHAEDGLTNAFHEVRSDFASSSNNTVN